MWVQVKSAPNLMVAEMWKELFEGEGIPTRLLPESDTLSISEIVRYRVLVPNDKKHLIEEILRKI